MAVHTEARHSQRNAMEARLVAKARSGDQEAMGELVRAYLPKLRSVAWRVVRNRADAEDVAQEALWKAWRHLPEFEQRASFSTWLTSITVNEAVGLLRKRRSRPLDLAEDGAPLDGASWPAPQGRTPEQTLASHEIERAVRSCVERTRPAYRAVLCLSLLNELDQQEIGKRLGLSVAAVKLRLHRGRHVLRKLLQHLGVVGCHRRKMSRLPASASQVSGN